jgi:hypothetical protein
MKSFFIKPMLVLIICFHCPGIRAQVTAVKFRVHVPSFESIGKDIYLARSFNNWNQKDSLYRMKKDGDGVYSLTIPVFKSTHYYYKYCLGSWQKVELNTKDSSIDNRHFIAFKRKKITDTVTKWKQPEAAKDSSVPLKKVAAMKDSLEMKLKPRVAVVEGLFKEYAQNMLQENPSIELHKQLDEKAATEISNIYRNITLLLWNICSSLSSQQKQQVTIIMAGRGEADFVNGFLNAVKSVVK